MPVKINYPKKTVVHKQKLLIAHGKCDNSAKITITLTNKATGQAIAGQAIPCNNARCWGYRYQNLAKGDYTLTLTQVNSPATTDIIEFSTDPPQGPPPAGAPPMIMTPMNGDAVATIFFASGTSNQALTQCKLSCAGQPDINALSAVQGPDPSGDWSATIDASSYPAGSNGCTLTVANAAGPSSVNGLALP